jgi:putative PIN family toxin of toxin-antitoxin system
VNRVVADTNVYVSALHFGGFADDILALERPGALEVFVSPAILTEVERVLVRKFSWSPARAGEAVAAIRRFATMVRPTERLALVEAHNRILECAVAAVADAVVTGGQDLLRLKRFRDIVMVSPREFLRARTRAQGGPAPLRILLGEGKVSSCPRGRASSRLMSPCIRDLRHQSSRRYDALRRSSARRSPTSSADSRSPDIAPWKSAPLGVLPGSGVRTQTCPLF